ncbi:tRNA (N(6)-L-threonylcarbamoyladenosine(37)-C(2))-methylthiotransferase MtaB [Clostridium sp. DL1XJH146]
MKVAFATLGCKSNLYETEAMIEIFKKNDYEIVDFNEFADVYVVNTCTVTNMSDKKSRAMISRARKKNELAIIAAVGCYSQIDPDKVASISHVDVVLGTRNKGEILYWINRSKEEKKQFVVVKDVMIDKEFEDLSIEEFEGKTRAFLKIQDGCNSFCSYCLIPYSRGAICSKLPERVIAEASKLAANGFEEIILSGISISSYGKDLEGEWDLVKIIEELNKIGGLKRIRIGSIGPKFFTDENIDRLKNIEKLCPHFHISLQSGCDETLRRMNRNYNADEYRNVVMKLRETMEDLSVTTDVIVGFPGETDEEFNKTYEFLKKIKLSKTHIFKYSPRKGTKAAVLNNQINGNIKDERSKRLLELNIVNEAEFLNRFKDRFMEVLYEQEKEENIYEGYTPNYIRILTKADIDLKGKIKETKLIEEKEEHMIGHL